ncbi:hypothetical protein FRC10_004585, partial [Ceratobasidium sp. 414]
MQELLQGAERGGNAAGIPHSCLREQEQELDRLKYAGFRHIFCVTCLVQPDANTWPTSHEGSLELPSAAGSYVSGSRLVSPSPASGKAPDTTDRAESVRRVSAYLGTDALRYLNTMLQKVVAQIKDPGEEIGSGPMEIETGSALMPVQCKVSSEEQYAAAHNLPTLEQLRLVPPADNSDTKPESESQMVELGPNDSVSQHVPPIPWASLHSSHPRLIPHAPNYMHKAKPTCNAHVDSDTNTVDESDTSLGSDTEPKEETEPPPLSNVTAVLTWASHLAKQAGTLRHMTQANDFQLLTTVLDNLRCSHLVTPTQEQVQLCLQHVGLTGDNASILEAKVVLTLGTHVIRAETYTKRPCHKATLADFPGFPRHIATLAIPNLVATAIAKGAYELHESLSAMVTKCYNNWWAYKLPDLQLQKVPPGLVGVDFLTNIDPYEYKALAHCIAAAFFWATNSIGMISHDKFYPMPLPIITMVLTTMQHCISEWKTSQYILKELNVDTQCKMYEAHLASLQNYHQVKPDNLKQLQIDWFCSDYTGGTLEDDEPYQAITWADCVLPDVADPDDDAEHGSHSSTNIETHP